PGGKQYGIPSVVVQLHAEAAIRIRVPPQVFVPPPAVDSVVLTIDRLSVIPEHAARAVLLASSAFGQRRKMIKTSLAGAARDVEKTLEAAGIDGRLRAADLSPLDYLALAEASAS
ncbi:MAG TPA: rRNA adenine N-6-methyltransferase family protein, partial [Acidimicrobiia bacterium]